MINTAKTTKYKKILMSKKETDKKFDTEGNNKENWTEKLYNDEYLESGYLYKVRIYLKKSDNKFEANYLKNKDELATPGDRYSGIIRGKNIQDIKISYDKKPSLDDIVNDIKRMRNEKIIQQKIKDNINNL